MRRPEVRTADKHCRVCDRTVTAERKRSRWRAVELVLILLSAGLWVPLKMMYRAIVVPWSCSQCQHRIEPWYRDLRAAATSGLCGLFAAWMACSVAVVLVRPQPPGATATQRSADAIAREKQRRESAEAEFRANRAQIMAKLRELDAAGRYSELVGAAAPYTFVNDPEFNAVLSSANRRVKEAKLISRAEAESSIERKANLYRELMALDPTNSAYSGRYQKLSAQLAERAAKQAAAAEARRKEAAAEAARRAAEKAKEDALVEKFGPRPHASAWDGSYREVERYLEGVMNDPDSLEIDGCTGVSYTDSGWLVGCNFRGRNGFGGMVRNANWFTIRYGRVTQMHDYSAFRE